MGLLRLAVLLFASALGVPGAAAYASWSGTRRAAFVVAFLALDGVGIWKIAHAVAGAARSLPRWDFLCFYLYGRVAVLARDVYDPSAFHRIGVGLSADPEWTREILDVGFPYPPDSIVVPYVLGFFKTPASAFWPWYALLLAGLIACVALARRYVGGPWFPAALVPFAFVCSWTPAIDTLELAQTIFLVAAFVFAYALEPRDWRAGVWLALAVVVKPFVLLLVLVPLLRRQWYTLASGAATLFAACVASAVLLGPATVMKYVSDNPLARYPSPVYLESVNVSLFSTLLRLRHIAAPQQSVAHDGVFVACALAFVLATVALIARDRVRERDGYSLALAICTALILFPQTLTFYTFLLLVPFAIVWKRAPANAIVLAAATAVDAALAGRFDGNAGTGVLVLNWFVFAYLVWSHGGARTGEEKLAPR